MAKSSEIDDAFSALSTLGAKKAVLYILEELTLEAERVVLECPSSDTKLSEKLIKSQTHRNLLTLFKTKVK